MIDSARYTFASHLAVLRSCPYVISRLLKNGGSVLLAAKVLVVSRLLHTKLSQRSSPPPFLETLRIKLGRLRKRLLHRIDSGIKRLNITRDVLVEAMCAFSLATSSSAKEVLLHYHHIRQEAISGCIGEKSSDFECLLVALRLYVKTLRDIQAIIPNHLSLALEKLKSKPLLKSEDVFVIAELNLDVHGRWIDEDVRSFTPYVRHDDLSKVETEKAVRTWAKKSLLSFLGQLRDRIKDIEDPLKLIHLRQQLLELWLSNHQHSIGIDSVEILDGLRDAFNVQASRIMQSRGLKLDRVRIVAWELMQTWQRGISDSVPSLWDSSMASMEASRGGKAFRETLAARSRGQTEPLGRISDEYVTFLESMEVVEDAIKQLRETKWTDYADDIDDVDALLDHKQVLLSGEDASLMQQELGDTIHKAYADLQSALSNLNPDKDDENRGQKSCFLLRVWRLLRQRLPQSYQNNSTTMGHIAIFGLQNANAEEVLHAPMHRVSKRLGKIARAVNLPLQSLWEGDPPLPVSPSLWTYRLLLDLTASMTACGRDIWSPQAIDVLKMKLMKRMVPLLINICNHDAPRVNGHANDKTNSAQDQREKEEISKLEFEEGIAKASQEPRMNGSIPVDSPNHLDSAVYSRNFYIQSLFDVNYLVNATTTENLDTTENELLLLQSKLVDNLALETESIERINRNAAEYWKRTSLLFGLLA